MQLEGLGLPASAQVEEMAKAVDVAEKNMARFGLTQAEISSRRKWVLQTRRQVCRAAIMTQGFPCRWLPAAVHAHAIRLVFPCCMGNWGSGMCHCQAYPEHDSTYRLLFNVFMHPWLNGVTTLG